MRMIDGLRRGLQQRSRTNRLASRRLPVLALLLAFWVPVAHGADPAAPDFTLPSRDAGNVRLSELRGQVVMLNFWASWCGPCRQEMPLLDALYKRYKDLGFVLLGISVDEDRRAARRFLDSTPVTFPILFDQNSEVSRLYQVQAMPSTLLVDRDGNTRYLHRGYIPGDESKYAAKVRELLRE